MNEKFSRLTAPTHTDSLSPNSCNKYTQASTVTPHVNPAPLRSDRTASMERFSPLFYGKKDQQLPFTDSDGLYDFPSSDGKGSSATATHHRKSTGRRRDRRSSSRSGGQSLSPSKSTSVLLEIPGGGGGGGSKDHNSSTYNSHGGGVTVAAGAGGGSKYYSSTTTPTRKSPKRRPLYRHPVASSSSSSESLTSTREYAQRSSKGKGTFFTRLKNTSASKAFSVTHTFQGSPSTS